ncbi:MAG: hypothetical protein RLN96_03395 [Pseudomonadales bacterium]
MQATSDKWKSPPAMRSANGGFSMFELVVYIIAVAIIYATAANRFAEFPAEAERANFLAVTTQLQSAINLEMWLGVSNSRPEVAANLAGVNPMELLLEPPINYLGAFDQVNTARLERRIWYFDRPSGELVYLIDGEDRAFVTTNGVERPTDEIRFKIVAQYSRHDAITGLIVTEQSGLGSDRDERHVEEKFAGVVLRPVSPFRWANRDERELVGIASN